MRWQIKYFVVVVVFFLLLPVSVALAVTPPVPARPPGRVVDLADIIDQSTRDQLSRLLQDLEQKISVQMVVLTVKSLDGEDINSFSIGMAEQWRLGQKGKDNGLLLTVALRDRKYRFEVGYGLESVLPDSLAGSIGRQALVPYFKQGRYSRGIAAATGEVIRVLARHYGVEIAGLPKAPAKVSKGNDSTGFIILAFMFMFILMIRRMRNNRRNLSRRGPGMVIFPGGGWGGGGGFGGGFSGGGGGFGGGGASGGW